MYTAQLVVVRVMATANNNNGGGGGSDFYETNLFRTRKKLKKKNGLQRDLSISHNFDIILFSSRRVIYI